MERLVQLLKGDEPKSSLPEGEDISTLEVDENQMEVNRPTYFTPVTGAAAAAAVAPVQKETQKSVPSSQNVDGKADEVDEDDIIEEV